MAYRVIREDNRSEGLPVIAGEVIIAGAPVMLAVGPSGLSFKKATDAAMPYGIACESTEPLPMAPASGPTVGQGFDYTNYARGGKVAAFVTGSELELFDDGHGLPFEAAGPWALNAPVYVSAAGKLAAAGTIVVGYVVDFDNATAATRLRVKFAL